MGLHDGHRERVLNKFLKNGFTGLEEHEKLEIILFYSVPRINTNELAHVLLNKYRTVANVMDAPIEELVNFKGITLRTVALFKLIKETYSLYHRERLEDKAFMKTTEEFGTYFQLYLATSDDEKLVMMSLDARGKMLSIDTVSEGDINTVSINSRKMAEIALRTKANEVVIAHNHPGNVAFPSRNDVMATETLVDFMQSVGVKLSDHYIVSKDDYFSMANHEKYKIIFGN